MMEEMFISFGKWVGDGVAWLAEGGVNMLIEGAGMFCRYMTLEVSSSFLLFGVIGLFLVMAGAKEKGVRMANLAIVVYLIMLVIGATC